MKKHKKLAVRLTIYIAIVLLIIFTVLILVIAVTTGIDLQKRELKKLELLAHENANIAKDYMETMINKQEAIVSSIETIDGSDEDRLAYIETLLETIGREEEHILSLFFVSEPNAFFSGTPDGMSVFISAGGVHTQKNRFEYVKQDIYQEAVKNGQMTVADPFSKIIDGTDYNVITVFLPVRDREGNVAGMVGSNIDTEVLMGAPYDSGGYETFNNEIICGHKTVILNSRDHQDVGKKYMDVSTSAAPAVILQAAIDAKSFTLLDAHKDGSRSYRAFVPFYVGDSSVPWLSGTSIRENEFQAQIIRQIMLILAVSLAGLAALVLFSLYIIQRMLKPLKKVEDAVGRLSRGELQARVEYHKNDEIGRLAESFNNSMETIMAYVQDIDRAMEEMARGNFDVYPSVEFRGDFANIETSITSFIMNMCQTLQQMSNTAEVVMCGSEQMAEGSSRLSQGAEEQSASIQELNASISILSEHVQSNDQEAREAGRRVEDAGRQLENSAGRMDEMTRAMSLITANSKEIQNIIKTIEDIAFQTNILALNAAVEAARAGTAGKGFSVVAGEVGTLAAKSAKAAKSTAQMIEKSLLSIDSGASLAVQAADSLETVREKAASVMEIVEEICVSSSRQLSEIETISLSTGQISEVVQTNSATAEESAATAQELSSQSQMMRSITARFQLNSKLIQESK